MPRLLYSATMSLDGYIAGPGGDMSWLTPHLAPNPDADDLVGRIGALLVGARTHRGDDPNQGTDKEGAFSGQWQGPVVVLTHEAPTDESPGTVFTDDIAEAVRLAMAAAGDAEYVNVLGADVARQLLAMGAVDEVLAIVAPVVLGDGIPLLAHSAGYDLERTHVSTTAAAVNLWFRVVGPRGTLGLTVGRTATTLHQ